MPSYECRRNEHGDGCLPAIIVLSFFLSIPVSLMYPKAMEGRARAKRLATVIKDIEIDGKISAENRATAAVLNGKEELYAIKLAYREYEVAHTRTDR